MSAALSGTRTERNTIISSRNDIATTAAMKSGSRLGDAVGQVGDHRLAGERHPGVGAGDRGGQHVGAEVADELVGALVLRRGGRVGGEHARCRRRG